MMNITAKLLIAAGVVFPTFAAAGNLVNQAQDNPFSTARTSLVRGDIKTQDAQFRVIGTPEKKLPAKDGFGRDLSLTEALGQLVPRDYALRVYGVADNQKFNWRGGGDWVSTLRDMTTDMPGMVVEVNHAERIVQIMANTLVTANAKSNGDGSGGSKNWEIRTSDTTISRALRRWGEESGYQVIWESPKDFPVMASAAFSGSFHDALKAVIESLSKTDSPMQATYYVNGVVHITRYNGQSADLEVRQ